VVAVAVPLLEPSSSVDAVVAVVPAGSMSMIASNAIHPIASVTCTVYVPAVRPVVIAVVSPLSHE